MSSRVFRTPIVRAVQLALLCAVTFVMLGADSASRFNRIGHGMICMCGCTQILLECNHVGCPVSPVMISELHAQIASGASDKAIYNWFAAKYGAVVLAAPTRGGFDDVAWVMPILIFVLATAGTAVVVWLWRRRTLQLAGTNGNLEMPVAPFPETPQDEAMRERIRRETEY
jgi:cytochrome c-type biogenesis protein CcmH/NrfF